MQTPNNREIKINPNGWIANSDARTPASKSGGDSITWRALGQGGPWKVVFLSTSPFASTNVHGSERRNRRFWTDHGQSVDVPGQVPL